MKRILVLLLFIGSWANAQELKATVTVNYSQVTAANTQIFKTLERQLADFINQTKWTIDYPEKAERIPCSFFITVQEYGSNNFSCTLQVSATRPVFNSTFYSPLVNFNDKDFEFQYIEYQNLFYDPNTFNSNLVSVLAFYANVIIGIDAISFSSTGGTKAFENALQITNIAQSSNYKGWLSSESGNNNRYYLITDLLSNTFKPYHQAVYEYHSKGMDNMADNPDKAKKNIQSAIETLATIQSVRPNALLTRAFFDAKADEIVSIFSGGPKMSIVDIVNTLQYISPTNNTKWAKIQY